MKMAVPASSVHDIKTLVLSRHPVIVIESVEEGRVDALVSSAAGDLRMALFEWTITQGLFKKPGSSAIYGTADPQKLLGNVRELTVEGIFVLKDFAPQLTSAVISRAFREVAKEFGKPARLSTLVLTGAQVSLPVEIEQSAVRYELQLPEAAEYRQVIGAVIESLSATGRAKIDVRGPDLDELARAVTGMTLNQARQAIARTAIKDEKLSREDIPRIVQLKARMIRDEGLLEFFPRADNKFKLGGFSNLQAWLDRARIGFGDKAEELNLTPPRGILMVGVQGCGKSLAAKVIARQWDLPLLKLDAGRLYDKYVGETEKNFRQAVSLAERMAPVVLWIDEIEKGMAPGGGDADGGLSKRLFGSFLTWMQEKRKEVFVVATANDLSILPPEFLRKGRFDEIFFVDLPTHNERETIFKIHLALRKQDEDEFDIGRLTEATDRFSGAEIEQVVIASLYRALSEDNSLDTEILLEEIGSTVPLAVSRREDIDELRKMAEGRFVNV